MKIKSLIFLLLLISSQSYGGIVVLNGLTHTHDVAQGSIITNRIRVHNNGKKEAKVLIYQNDMIVSCENSIDYVKTNSHDRSLGDWLKTNVEEKLLQSNEIYDIVYTITIPAELKESGTYWSVIMIEGADPIKEEMDKNVKIESKVRYAIQVIANVGNIGNIGSSKISFENITFNPKDSTTQVLNIKLKNSGAFVSKVKLSLEVYDATGKKLKTVESALRRIYPNKCNEFEILIKDLPKGSYNGILVADNGKDLFGSNVTLEIN